MTGNIALLLTIYSLWIIAGLVAFGWEFARRRRYGSKSDLGANVQQAQPVTDGQRYDKNRIEMTFGPQLRVH
jgi:hypothetical protein